MGIYCDGRGCGGCFRSSRSLACPDMFAVGLEEFTRASGVVFSYSRKVSVWVRHVVVIVRSINHGVFPYFVESMCGYAGWDIIGKCNISVKILL